MIGLQIDVMNGLAFITGLIGVMSGEFIISRVIITAPTVAGNIGINRNNRFNRNRSKLQM